MRPRQKLTLLFALLGIFLLGTNSLLAGNGDDGSPGLTDSKLSRIEVNLICALESNSPGLQASAAQVIRDAKARVPAYSFARSIVPLMRILKDENQEIGVRQIAALALHEIGSERGDYAIQREASFCEQPHLKRLCQWLTYAKLYGDMAATDASNSKSPQFISSNK